MQERNTKTGDKTVVISAENVKKLTILQSNVGAEQGSKTKIAREKERSRKSVHQLPHDPQTRKCFNNVPQRALSETSCGRSHAQGSRSKIHW